MNRSHLLGQFLAWLFCWTLVNLLIALKSEGLPSRQHLRKVDGIREHTVLLCGNSLMAAAGDAPGMEAALGKHVVNIALGATYPVEHVIILEHALATAPRAIIYGFFDRQLSEDTTATWRDIFGNRTVGLVGDPTTAMEFYCKTAPRNRLGLLMAAHLPSMQDRASVWAKVEILRRKMAELGFPKEKTNTFGRAADFTLLESNDPSRMERDLEAARSKTPVWNAAIDRLLQDAGKNGARFVFVRMPMTSKHRANTYETEAYKRYFARVSSDAAARGAEVIDAAEWLPDSAFADAIHAGPEGALAFSSRLGRELRSRID